ncbi:MAG: AI-2E family transporter [Dechloromonas sp.]|jgi:predicted PurR-regulated permease PerM|nr:MAG: AI-2E family transporter [Dechloromonas sp.]HRD73807.1 AI-2E family transporter [Aquimonas sp.]HRF55200.1 AI-2E family transporter [Aquimonas sp.]
MTDTQKWQLLALTVVLSALLYLLAPVLTPFAAAALFAYLGDPLVDRLETWRLSRTAAVAVVFGLMTLAVVGIVLLLIPMLQKQIVHFGERFPVYLAWFETVALPWLEQQTGFDLDRLQVGNLLGMAKQYWQQAGSAAATVFGGLSRSGMAVLEFIANLTLIPVVTFYLLRDWDGMVARIRELLPRAIEPTVVRLANESDAVLGSFLRGQVSVMLALGAIYTLGLSLIGIDLALLIGMIAGLVSFVPYLGVIVGFGAGLIAALVQHGDLLHVLLVAGVFGFGQIIEGFVLTPWLVGDKIGMHPVAVIFAIMAGGQLFGFLGVLLALPVAAVIMVVLRWLHERYTESSLYGAAERAVEDAVIHEVAQAAPVDSAPAEVESIVTTQNGPTPPATTGA